MGLDGMCLDLLFAALAATNKLRQQTVPDGMCLDLLFAALAATNKLRQQTVPDGMAATGSTEYLPLTYRVNC